MPTGERAAVVLGWVYVEELSQDRDLVPNNRGKWDLDCSLNNEMELSFCDAVKPDGGFATSLIMFQPLIVFTTFSMGFWFLSPLLLPPQTSASSSPYSCYLLTCLWKLKRCEENLHILLLPRVSRLTTGSAFPSVTIRTSWDAVPGPAEAPQLNSKTC